MDDRLFDDLARNLGRSVTRKSVLKLLAGISASGVASLASIGGSKAKKSKSPPASSPTCRGFCNDAFPCPSEPNCACNRKHGQGFGTCGAPQMCGGKCRSSGDCLAGNCFCKKKHGKGTNGGGHDRGTCSPLPCSGPCLTNFRCKLRGGGCTCNKQQGHLFGTCGTPQICEGTCSSTADCPILNDCVCNRLQGEASGTCGAPQTCAGTCTSDAQCPDAGDCVCNKLRGAASGTCGAPQICSMVCATDADCLDIANCVCNGGTCGPPPTCAGTCHTNSECPAVDCACNKRQGDSQGTCGVPQTCSGSCVISDDCLDVDNCVCNRLQGQETGTCGEPEICGGSCNNDGDCLATPNCVCNGGELAPQEGGSGSGMSGTCGRPTPPSPPIPPPPPGTCSALACADNAGCVAAGGDQCVCFTGSNTAQEVAPAATGTCAECLGTGSACVASTECCGQLVCLDNGTCGIKPPPPQKCHKQGQSCSRDNDCCAQGICYRGKCGEKDTHCNNDGECAKGYRCQGGPLSPGHRRCRRNSHRRHHRKH